MGRRTGRPSRTGASRREGGNCRSGLTGGGGVACVPSFFQGREERSHRVGGGGPARARGSARTGEGGRPSRRAPRRARSGCDWEHGCGVGARVVCPAAREGEGEGALLCLWRQEDATAVGADWPVCIFFSVRGQERRVGVLVFRFREGRARPASSPATPLPNPALVPLVYRLAGEGRAPESSPAAGRVSRIEKGARAGRAGAPSLTTRPPSPPPPPQVPSPRPTPSHTPTCRLACLIFASYPTQWRAWPRNSPARGRPR